jgi:hypothetical protein
MPPQAELSITPGARHIGAGPRRPKTTAGKRQGGHVGGGPLNSTSARSQGRAAPSIALRAPAMHASISLCVTVFSMLTHHLHQSVLHVRTIHSVVYTSGT